MAGSQTEDAPKRTLLPAGVRSRLHLVRYAAFAAAATAINVLSQNAALLLVSGFWFGIYLAMGFGTATGLVFKYICDKYWVFDDTTASVAGDTRKFAIYAFFGAFTTVLFWGVELGFHYVFKTQFMTSVGAVLGLSIGYVIKYNLDKHVTFRPAQPKA